MATKLQVMSELAAQATEQLTQSVDNWKSFLDSAAWLYKYPFHEQVLIYAQRPDAKACAPIGLWNSKFKRWVNRGAKGIALIDDSGQKPALRYVFDVSDTGERENSRPVNLWSMREEYVPAVQDVLERAYGVGAGAGLEEQIGGIASRLAAEYWEENKDSILGIVDDSFPVSYTHLTLPTI